MTPATGSISRLGYSDNENMQWIIPPEGGAISVELSFSEFRTEAGRDIVRLYRCTTSTCTVKTELQSLSGDLSPEPVVFIPGTAMVTWTSDSGEITGSGWAATWTADVGQWSYCLHSHFSKDESIKGSVH